MREIALLWDKDTLFERYLTDSGFDCEVVTPVVLAAPFFSFRGYKFVIVPAGFGNEIYSGILKELRASGEYLKEFVNAGATLLVSGAFSNKDAYNWLPIKLTYVMQQWRVSVEIVKEHKATAILEKEECLCDGYFAEIDAGSEIILRDRAKNGKAILVVSEYGAGRIIATTIHEYPSPAFIAYCVCSD